MPNIKIDFKSVAIGGGVAATAKVLINNRKFLYYITVKKTIADLWNELFYRITKDNEEADRNETIATLEQRALGGAILSPYI
ncbi:MAG: hypothetical protein WC069_05845 [Candidatus Shapirobacteria bacterium]